MKQVIHQKIVANISRICDWFSKNRQGIIFPIYSSFDIRDSGMKIANVDANIFPAGFNNICDVDREKSIELADKYLKANYSNQINKIVLLTEEHTQNPYYWENISALVSIFKANGRDLRIALPKEFSGPLQVESASGKTLSVFPALRKGNLVEVDGMVPDLIISNNDFSEAYAQWSEGLNIPINPPREMGWYRRKKSDYFKEYNQVMQEFCQIIDIDPWHLQVETKLFPDFDLANEESTKQLAQVVQQMLDGIKKKYTEKNIQDEPFVFIKNNSGTYGLGVMQVKSAEEVLSLNYKTRKKMKAAKGGRDVSEVIVQEGVPTSLTSEGGAAEPTIYLLGCELAGGFLRSHSKKGPTESLNSPGAVYKRLCVSDLEIDLQGRCLENVYGWVAKLGLLAISREYTHYHKSKN